MLHLDLFPPQAFATSRASARPRSRRLYDDHVRRTLEEKAKALECFGRWCKEYLGDSHCHTMTNYAGRPIR